jgi:hypothetical protein
MNAAPPSGLHLDLVSLADTVGLTRIFQRRLLSDESNFAFSTAPGTDDSHGWLISSGRLLLSAAQQEPRPR